MKMKILFIAPYSGLKELAVSVSEEYEDVQIDVYNGNYEKGPKLIEELRADENYDAIITRGGTVEICRNITSIPIVEIYLNAFDIVRIIKLSEGYEGKKIFLAYPSIVESFKQLSELLGYDLESKSYYEHKSVRKIVEELKKEGYELIIGDNIVYQTAQGQGINSMLLTSGVEGVRSAIDEAVRLCKAISKGREQGVLHVHYIENKNTENDSIDNFIRLISPEELNPGYLNTVFPRSIMSVITELSSTSLPTIITGEAGMCKSDVAFLCCCYGPQKRKRAVYINCDSIPVEYNYDLLERTIMKYFWDDGGTLFLEDIDQLCKEGQKKLIDILRKLNKNGSVKIIASSELTVEISVKSGRILRHLISILDEVRIELMPFKNYTGEINNMISIYLAKLDVRCSSQVAGINQGGIKLLSAYDWPGNVHQFMRVINGLTLTCNGAYITEKQVKDAIKNEQENFKQAALVPIDLNGSLKEIEARIIKHVMAEEGMNQANVEKRLKIGHSTLWRKLK